ncbi:MAG: hypothetical protein EHM79_14210 [Geobacter sp.]|nr:MAG: hypothetical protein EHM79_14210 [Geobacter sp.]
MKRVILAAASIIALSGMAYAGNIPTDSSFTFKPSNNVGSSYFEDDQNYVANTKHAAGTRIYSSSNNTSNIWYKEVTKASVVTDNDVIAPGESLYDGWTSQ